MTEHTFKFKFIVVVVVFFFHQLKDYWSPIKDSSSNEFSFPLVLFFSYLESPLVNLNSDLAFSIEREITFLEWDLFPHMPKKVCVT